MSIAAYTQDSTHLKTLHRGGVSTDQALRYQRVWDKLDWVHASQAKKFLSKSSTTGPTGSPLNCDGWERVVFKTEFSAAGNSCILRIIPIDDSDNKGLSVEFDPENTGIQGTTNIETIETGPSYYHGEYFEWETDGATEVDVYVVSVSSGDISLWGCRI